jgi:uncharacterized protein YbjT (DUF2867 family)
MKIVVIGGSGLIGSKVVNNLTELGHEAIPASPQSGVNTLTGEGLADVLAGAQVVVDVSNSPSFADDDVMRFFTTSTRNLLDAEQAAGVNHHVALSIVGCDRVPESGYMRAKVTQEKLIKESPVPYSLVRATQFFEFVMGIAGSATDGDTVRLPHTAIQPIAAQDVATAVTRAAADDATNGTTNIAGPEKFGMDEFVRTGLAGYGDAREVIADPSAEYFGAPMNDSSIVPVDGENATIFETRFADWLASNVPSAAR